MTTMLNNKYDKIIEKIVLFSYFFHQMSFVLSGSSIARANITIYKIITGIMIVSFLLIMLSDLYYLIQGKFSKKEIFIYSIIGIILVTSFYYYRSVMILANFFAIASFKNINVKNVMKYYLYATSIGIIVVVIIGIFTKYTGDIIQVRYGVERIRHGLGFFYPSLGSFYYSSLVIAYILTKDKIKFYNITIILIIGVFFFIFTDVKAGLGYVVLTLLLYYFIVLLNNDIIYKLFGYVAVICYPLFCSMTILLSIFYDKNNFLTSTINNFVTSRLYLAKNSIMTFGIKLFGQDVPISNGDQYHVDSSFIVVLLSHGVIILILSLCFMTYFCYITYKQKNKALLIALFMIALRATFDLGFMALQFSPVVLLFYSVFDGYNKCKNSTIKG